MIVGVPKESLAGEARVALTPGSLAALLKAGMTVLIEAGAGTAAGYPDAEYTDKGAQVVARAEVFGQADVILQINGPTTHAAGAAERALLRPGQTTIAFHDPLWRPEGIADLAASGARAFSMELIPRITRAQSMDALSSMANIAGYKAVLIAASELPRMFPMFMTAAGTVSPAKVLVIGVGVAGLQAIATAKRLGAKVEGYDVRPAVKEQVESLSAKFVELDLETAGAQDEGGYAKEQSDVFLARQRAQMSKVIARQDVVITTAAIPGRRSPLIISADMARGMAPCSVIVDLAAERGGNCELTKAGERVVDTGVTILGPTNLPATVPYHASQLYAKNISSLLLHLVDKEGHFALNIEDEITRETLLCDGGQVVHARCRELLENKA
jgi:NAD(P) transhydrogenase subunit alpha